MRISGFFIAVATLFVLTGCGSDDPSESTPQPAATVTETATVTATVTTTVTTTPSKSPEPAATQSPLFPKGFPRVVPVSKVPHPVSSAFGKAAKVVAIAPGVWTDLPPGASVMDAATAGVANGFCASIDAY